MVNIPPSWLIMGRAAEPPNFLQQRPRRLVLTDEGHGETNNLRICSGYIYIYYIIYMGSNMYTTYIYIYVYRYLKKNVNIAYVYIYIYVCMCMYLSIDFSFWEPIMLRNILLDRIKTGAYIYINIYIYIYMRIYIHT